MNADMTAAEILKLNGDMRQSPLMDAVRHFDALARSHQLPYCIVGGLAVIRNGYPRTTIDVDVLTFKQAWRNLLPLEGEITSQGIDNCVDKASGVTIDILFADDDWEMVIPMPDPLKAGEYDEELGARFIRLHDLVQLKMAVHLSKLRESGMDVAAKDLSDVYELMRRNLAEFSPDIIRAYDPAVRKSCMRTFESAARASKREKRR